ncbi:MAG: hypothetical protein ACRC62_09285 [Microcoleus sp.]
MKYTRLSDNPPKDTALPCPYLQSLDYLTYTKSAVNPPSSVNRSTVNYQLSTIN